MSGHLKDLPSILLSLQNPNDQERSVLEGRLFELRNTNGFVKSLMIIINDQTADLTLRTIAVAVLSDNVKNYYNSSSSEIIYPEDKQFLKANVLDSITLNMGCPLPSIR